jgi:hypothetical protein
MSYGLEPARLDENLTKNIHALEQNLQCWVVALQPKANHAELASKQPAKLHPAEMSEAQLKQLQQAESETNLLLMAYKAA